MHRFVILLSMVAAVLGSESFFNKYAFSKVMSSCFGEEVYSNYLGMLGTAKQRCQQQPVFIGSISDMIILPVLGEHTDKKPSYVNIPIPLFKKVKMKGSNMKERRPLNEPIDHTKGSDGKDEIMKHFTVIQTEKGHEVHYNPRPDESDRFVIPESEINPAEIHPIYHTSRQDKSDKFGIPEPEFLPAELPHTTLRGESDRFVFRESEINHAELPHTTLRGENDRFVIRESEINHAELPHTTLRGKNDRFVIRESEINHAEAMTLQSKQFIDVDNVKRTIEQVKAKISNFTCTLREIGYIDYDLKIKKNFLLDKYLHSPIDEDLKSDLINILVDCQQYKKCFPESNERYGIPVELQRLIKVVQCERMGILKACFKHDLRKDIDQLHSLESSNGSSPVEDLERMVSLLMAADALGELEILR